MSEVLQAVHDKRERLVETVNGEVSDQEFMTVILDEIGDPP
jgi:hypothetical protein